MTPIFAERDVSWLSFNYRVLQEAKDPTVPLLERVKFLGIFSSNMDEFFRVRIASIKNLIRAGKKTSKQVDFDAPRLLAELLAIVHKHMEEFNEIFENQLIPALRRKQLFILKANELDTSQRDFLEKHLNDRLRYFLHPVVLNKQKIAPFLVNAALYLAVVLEDKKQQSKYALVRIPSSDLGRFFILPSPDGHHDMMILDDTIRYCLPKLFPEFKVIGAYSFKLTRDAELNIDDEFDGDLIAKIKLGLSKRNSGPATRFIYDRTMPKKLLLFLTELFSIGKDELLPEGTYHNNSDLLKFPEFSLPDLRDEKQAPLGHPRLKKMEKIWSELDKGDVLLHFPYHSYEPVLRFFEQAANDPLVTHIKITQYRVAKNSKIMAALKVAVQKGKKVSAFIEVKARFDEDANLQWATDLESIGVKVFYSLPGVKVHAKVALLVRNEEGKQVKYAYLSTGNFNENTSKLYVDYGLFTKDKKICAEVSLIFGFLESGKPPATPFSKLLVGLFNLYDDLHALIDFEIAEAKAGREASILLKMNSIEEKGIIEKLYAASNAGVKITLIVRGICCLVPGIKGQSEHIKVYSLVDRYLEHSRVFNFHHGGEDLMYLSSADWMARNLLYRVECTFPINNRLLVDEIKQMLNTQLSDNCKLRVIDKKLSNSYANAASEGEKIRAQEVLYRVTKG